MMIFPLIRGTEGVFLIRLLSDIEGWENERSLFNPPHPSLLPPGEKGLLASSPLRGED